MKKQYKQSVCFFLSILFVFLSLTSCAAKKQMEYYSVPENYISVSGTVSHFVYDEALDAYYLAFDDMSVALSDHNFKIVGENASIVRKGGIQEKINIGDSVSFVTAPKYWGDGYVMPIVEISVDGETLLEFNTGLSNLLNWLE